MASLINPLKSDSKETIIQMKAKENFVIEGADLPLIKRLEMTSSAKFSLLLAFN
jgi:hypothetical protein